MMSVRRPAVALLAALLVVATLASGCSDLQGTDGKQWITGEGKIFQIPAAERGKPVEASGEDLDGNPLDLADYRGRVVVVNVWAAWCPPCRAEMPTVVALAASVDPADVAVLGANIREAGGRSAAKAFVEDAGVDFPSFYDPSSEVPLALSDELGPYSLPSTAVLDRQGRLAALVIGSIPGRATMADLVDEIVAEPGGDDG